MQQIIMEHAVEIQRLCERYGVEKLYVFGSVVGESFHAHSDVDILVSFMDSTAEVYSENYFQLHYALEALLGRKIDLLTENALRNPYFIQSINASKKLLYAA